MSRPRNQSGQVLRSGSKWILKFWEDQLKDGQVERVRVSRPLADAAEFRTESAVRAACAERITAILAGVNPVNGSAAVSMTFGEFVERSYWPRCEFRLKMPPGNELHIEPSTVEGYRDIWKCHVGKSSIVGVRLRDFTARDGQRFLESLPQNLSHQTHLRIKNFVRGVFSWAIADGALSGANPMAETKAGGRKKKTEDAKLTERERKIQASNEHAYTLEEVAEMLDKLPEPARTVCAVAAFTGLTRSELRGLKWSDYDGETINVARKIWKTHEGAPKTEARESGVFVIPVLRKILSKYKTAFPSVGDGWVFRGEKMLRPLDLDNLSRRAIPQHINGAWFGWHAFRRGLGTRLNDAGVDAKTIQSILRHADVSTTQAYYILPDQKRAEQGMRKLDKTLRTRYGIKA